MTRVMIFFFFVCLSRCWKIWAFLLVLEYLNESCWWMIKGSCNLNKVRSAITRLFCPWLNAAPPHYGKTSGAPLVCRDRKHSQHTVSIFLFIKEIHLCLWEDTQASLKTTNSTICTLTEDELRVYYQAVIDRQLYFIYCVLLLRQKYEF